MARAIQALAVEGDDSLLLEEYKAKWAYLLHLEQQRDSLVKWYATLVGALTAVSLGLQTKEATPVILEPLKPAVLGFCVIYSVLVALYLLVQKRNYRYYHMRIQELEDKRSAQPRDGLPVRFLSSFRVYFAFPVTLGAGLAGLFAYSLSLDLAPSAMIASGYFLIGMLVTWLPLPE